MNQTPFVEIGSHFHNKFGQRVTGDTLIAQRIKEENRTVIILSDGLGSGIKASVLSTLTATMALKYITNHMNIEKAAAVIMSTLPICKDRRISYATFTIIDIDNNGIVHMVEYDNPPFLLMRGNQILPIHKKEVSINSINDKPATLFISEFQTTIEDRIIFHSDGLNQSGMGKKTSPLGWTTSGVHNYSQHIIEGNPTVSARILAKLLVEKALENDGWRCGDDTTCGVIYFREPRKLLVVTGPPVDEHNDKDITDTFLAFNGRKIICGGTTAKILSRELKRSISVDLRNIHPEVPPHSIMDGVDLITEGVITMKKADEYLNNGIPDSNNAAVLLSEELLDNDEITFLVGTRLNEANQLHLNQNIELRHSIVKKLTIVLEQKYQKTVHTMDI
jgi:hypothetical protein